ncbi:hypothetical protein ACFSVJ_24765 [Prauserella oleivorans]
MGKIVGRRSGVLLGIVLLGLLSGCAGEDLAKANFQRTTVSAEPGTGQGEVPEGPITDPAVSQSALRTVDPCGLLTDRIVGDLGSLADEPYRSDWGSCRVELRDAGDKTVDVGLELGETVIAEPTGGIEGLPLVESTLDDGTCFVTAVTGYEPTVGVTAQVEYPGGNACDAGYTLVGNVIRELRADPRGTRRCRAASSTSTRAPSCPATRSPRRSAPMWCTGPRDCTTATSRSRAIRRRRCGSTRACCRRRATTSRGSTSETV